MGNRRVRAEAIGCERRDNTRVRLALCNAGSYLLDVGRYGIEALASP